jgi:hypothetical protein
MAYRPRQETDTQKVIRLLTRTPYEEMMQDLDDLITSNRGPIPSGELFFYVWETHGWTEGEMRQYLAGL